MSSKVSNKAKKVEQAADVDMDTSDDDYVDPAMDKYFEKNKGESKIKSAAGGKSGLWNEEDEDVSDYEEEEEPDDEDMSEEEEEDDDEDEVENGENGHQEENGDGEDKEDGRKKLTMNLIKKWSDSLGVSKAFFFSNHYTR